MQSIWPWLRDLFQTPRAPKGNVLDLVHPRMRIIFDETIEHVQTKKVIRFETIDEGFLISVGAEHVFFISGDSIRDAFYADDYKALDSFAIAAGQAVISELGS